MRKHLSTLLKVTISIVGLAIALSQVPFAALTNELAGIHWGWLVAGLLLIVLGTVLRAYRWLVLVQGLQVEIPFARLVNLYFVGSFFNTFLPSGFGGDVVRVLEAARDVPGHIAAGTVIVDRLSGLLMLFVMALLALPFRDVSFPDSLFFLILALSLAGLLGGILLFEGRLIRRMGGWLPGKLSVTDPEQPLARLLFTVQACGLRAVFKALLVSTIFNLTLVWYWQMFGRALGYDVSYGYYLLVVPIMSVMLLVPSVGGLGVREVLAPILFAPAGLTAAQAIAHALLVTVIVRVAGLIGGPIYAFSAIRDSRRTRETASNNSS